MERRTAAVLSAALLAIASGCSEPEKGPIPRERFIEASVALRMADFPSGDLAGTAVDSARLREDSARVRAEVLRRVGTTPEQMRAFLEAHRQNPRTLVAIAEEVSQRMAREDSLRSAARQGASGEAPDGAAPEESPRLELRAEDERPPDAVPPLR